MVSKDGGHDCCLYWIAIATYGFLQRLLRHYLQADVGGERLYLELFPRCPGPAFPIGKATPKHNEEDTTLLGSRLSLDPGGLIQHFHCTTEIANYTLSHALPAGCSRKRICKIKDTPLTQESVKCHGRNTKHTRIQGETSLSLCAPIFKMFSFHISEGLRVTRC